MNANELADKWDAQGFSEYELERECGNQMANMLRKQQAKIEALKQVLGRYVKEVPLGNQPHMLAHIALELVNG